MSFFGNIAHSVGSFFGEIPKGIEHVAHSIGGVFTEATSTIGQGARNLISPITQEVRSTAVETIRGVAPSVQSTIESVSKSGANILGGVSGVFGSLSLPLTIGLGIAGIYLVMMLIRR